MIRNTLCFLFSLLLLALATPNALFPQGLPWLGYIALVPLLLVLRQSHSHRLCMGMGALFGAALTVLQHSWLAAFETYAFWALAGPALGYGAYYLVLIPTLAACSQRETIYRPFRIVVIWTLFEYFKSVGYLGFPWGMLSNLGAEFPLLSQIADSTGMWGIGALLALSNAVVAEYCSPQKIYSQNRQLGFRQAHRQGMFLVACLLISSVYGAYRLIETRIPTQHLSVVLVQANIDPWTRTGDGMHTSLSAAQNLSIEGTRMLDTPPDLLIWPEGYLDIPYSPPYWNDYQDIPASHPFHTFLKEQNTYLLSGAALYEDGALYNAAVLLDREGTRLDFYAKQHLVPLGESIPGWGIPIVRRFFSEIVGISPPWEFGGTTNLLELPESNVRIAALICFEDSFAYLARAFASKGADLLINLTDNSWSGKYSTLAQQLSSSRFRAIETRRTLIRVGNNGITQVIDPWGKNLVSIPSLVPGVLATTVPIFVPAKESFYQRFGDVFILIHMLLLIPTVLFSRIRMSKKALSL